MQKKKYDNKITATYNISFLIHYRHILCILTHHGIVAPIERGSE